MSATTSRCSDFTSRRTSTRSSTRWRGSRTTGVAGVAETRAGTRSRRPARFEGEEAALPAPGVLEALAGADLILLAPSNPYVSVGPILAVHEVREALARRRVACVAVSPLIGGRAVKGPADRMLRRLAGGTSPRHVAACYAGLIDALVIDEADAEDSSGLGGVQAIVTRTLMSGAAARQRLAQAVVR